MYCAVGEHILRWTVRGQVACGGVSVVYGGQTLHHPLTVGFFEFVHFLPLSSLDVFCLVDVAAEGGCAVDCSGDFLDGGLLPVW